MGVPNLTVTSRSLVGPAAAWYLSREFGHFFVLLTQVLDGLDSDLLTQVFDGLDSDRGVHAEHLSHCVTLTGLFLDPQPQRVYDVIDATEFCQEKQSKAIVTKLDFSFTHYEFITVFICMMKRHDIDLVYVLAIQWFSFKIRKGLLTQIFVFLQHILTAVYHHLPMKNRQEPLCVLFTKRFFEIIFKVT